MNNATYLNIGPLFQMSNAAIVGISIALSIIVVFVLGIYLVSFFLRKLNIGYTLLDLIYDVKGLPSLSKFQFLSWSLVILFFFAIVAFIRIFGGLIFSPVVIPANLIYLLGISVSVVPVASYVSNQKYGEPKPNSDIERKLVYARMKIDSLERRTPMPDEPPGTRKRLSFAMILTEGDVPSLAKFQMFSWTWIAIGIYVVTFFRIIFEFASGTQGLSTVLLPDVDSALVALMGLSQAAYVGGKWTAPKSPSILEVAPDKANSKDDTKFTIRGVNFGNIKDMILIGQQQVTESDIDPWNDTMINFTLRKDIAKKLEPAPNALTVVVGGKKAQTTIKIEN